MGNCIRVRRAVRWADDDEGWEWAEGTNRQGHLGKEVSSGEEDSKLSKEKVVVAVQPATEVRIKISKKKLEELLRNVNAHGLPLHQMLAHAVSIDDQTAVLDRMRHWRPTLHSIPEVAE